MRALIGDTTLELVQGDITQQDVEATVNAANSGLAGGGVDSAIHLAGGPADHGGVSQSRDVARPVKRASQSGW
jgi:O-acetyl-ADP-ribose deacetylase (regulator of RNase III)